jgi:hypothetical protein
MTDPTIEEIRGQVKGHREIWANNVKEAEDSLHKARINNDESDERSWLTTRNEWILVEKQYEWMEKILEPKPRPDIEVIESALLEHERQVITKCMAGGLDPTYMPALDIGRKIIDRLYAEGYSFHYDGKPVQPKSSPVVDTGEDPKVQLAKQINTLAKLLDADGFMYSQFDDMLAIVNARACQYSPHLLNVDGNSSKDGAAQLALRLNKLHTDRKLYPTTLVDMLSVLRDQFILSTDITQAIDRLNELVSITSEEKA